MSYKRVTVQQKRNIIKRANGCCEYCRSQSHFATQSFSIDHIVPLSKGGKSTLDNLAFACQGCNNHKYNKTEVIDPVSKNAVPLYNPRLQRWYDHFGWNDDFTLIIGTTPTGRATVEALKLNREYLINLRRVLYNLREHPPAWPEEDK